MSIKLADALVEVFIDYAKAEQGATEMENRIGGLTRGSVAKLSAGMTAAGAAITGTLGIATKKAAEFGDGIGNVATLGVNDLDALKHGTMDVARQFGIDLNDAVQVTYDTISAGIPEDAAIMVMEQAARGARAGVGSLSEAMDLGTSVMNAWSLQGKSASETAANFEQIMGLAASTVKAGKTTIAELTTAIGATAPVMSAAGVGTEEFFAAVGALTKTGMPASQAMNSLKAAVSNVIKPGESAAKMAAALGLEFNAAALESQGLAGFLDNVRQKTGGNVETMGKLFGSVEGLNAIMALTGTQADSFTAILGDMGNATQNLAEMNDAYIRANPAEAFRQMKAELQVLFVQIGESLIPTLVKLAQIAKPILEWVNDFIQNNPNLTAAITITAGVFGTLATVLGTVGLAVAGLMPAFLALPGAAGAAGAAAGAAGAAAAGGVAGFGALAAGIGSFLLIAAPVAAIVGAAGFAIFKFGQLAIEVVKAQNELAESTARTNAEFEKYEAMLIRQGVQLDRAALKEMDHAARSRTIHQAATEHKEQLIAREIRAITGVAATRDQIHRAELARVGLMVSREEAAALAVQGITEREIRNRMASGQAVAQIEQKKVDDIRETWTRAEERLYVNLSTEVATLKVKGNAYEKAARARAQKEEEIRKQVAEVEKQLEQQMGQEKFKRLNEELQAVHEQSGLRKATEQEVFEFKRSLLQGDLEQSMQYWQQLREHTHSGLMDNLQQYREFSRAVQAEMADLRQATAYAMNPDQTGSPSLNQEAALGFGNYHQVLAHSLNTALSMIADYREQARVALVGMGGGVTGTPSDGDFATPGAVPGLIPGMGSGAAASPINITSPITINAEYRVPNEEAAQRANDDLVRQIKNRLNRDLVQAAIGIGLRPSALGRRSTVPSA